MRPKVRSILLNLALLAGSILLAMVAGEIVLRLFRPQPLEAASMWDDGTLRHRPSFAYTYTRGEFSNRVSFNSLGLRGPEAAPRAAPGVTRVLFLGDSFVEGKQVGDDEVLTAALEALAGRQGLRIEVVNAGVAGSGTSEEILLWDRLGAQLAPDVVIVGFYPNDVRNNIERRIFKITAGGGVVQHREPRLPRVRWIYDLRKVLASRSHLYMLIKSGKTALRERRDERRTGRSGHAPRGESGSVPDGSGPGASDGPGAEGRDSADEDGAGAIGGSPSEPEAAAESAEAGQARLLETEEVFEIEPTEEIRRGWELTEALLSELRRRVEASGARFVLAAFPTRFQVDRALWESHARRVGLDTARYDLEIPNRRLRAWADRTRTELIDLLGPFRERNVDNSFYYSIDAHWNPRGHALAASVIFPALMRPGDVRGAR